MTAETTDLLIRIGIVLSCAACISSFFILLSIKTEDLARMWGVVKPDAQQDS